MISNQTQEHFLKQQNISFCLKYKNSQLKHTFSSKAIKPFFFFFGDRNSILFPLEFNMVGFLKENPPTFSHQFPCFTLNTGCNLNFLKGF